MHFTNKKFYKNIILFCMIGVISIGLCIFFYSQLNSNAKTPLDNVIDNPSNKLEISDNTISLNQLSDKNIPDTETPLAFISGNSISTINKNFPYVYLQNDAENTDYYLEYEVYLEDDLLYKSKLIPCNSADPWDAYACEKIQPGTNLIWERVNIYSLNQELLASTTLNGLKIVKK